MTTQQSWKRHKYRCKLNPPVKLPVGKLPLLLKKTTSKSDLQDMLKHAIKSKMVYNDNRVYNVEQKIFNDNRSVNIKTHVHNPSDHQIEPEDIISHMIKMCGSKEAAMKHFAKYFELRGLKQFITDLYVPKMNNFRGYPWIKDKNGIGLTGKDALMPVICNQYSVANMRYLDLLFAQHCGNLLGAVDGSNRIVKATKSARLADRWQDDDVNEQYKQAVEEKGLSAESAPGEFGDLAIK